MKFSKQSRDQIFFREPWRIGAAALVLAAALGACAEPAMSEEKAKVLPAPALDAKADPGLKSEIAVFAGGCFWGLEGVFEHVRGVKSVRSGYSGGAGAEATYQDVSSGTTGHAESVEIVFDPNVVTYGQLLQIYFSVTTDPTQLNYQGPDHGTQYRSDIFYANEGQAKIARAYIAQLTAAKSFDDKIVTRVDPLKKFYAAEDHHQNYLSMNPDQPYIARYDMPKLANLQKLFPNLYTPKKSS